MNILENQPLLAAGAKTHEGIERIEAETLRLRKILVPLDFSECSRPTPQYAARVARQFGATLTFLHAALPLKLAAENIASDLIEISRQELGPDFGADAIPKSDLLVIETHDSSWWKRLTEGGPTEQLVRHAPSAVISLRETRNSNLS